jgi:hypothetical protein
MMGCFEAVRFGLSNEAAWTTQGTQLARVIAFFC